MARPYSLDLRERVVAAVMAGENCRAVAASFRVSVAAVVKWSQRFRATGSAAARPMAATGLERCRTRVTGYWPAWPSSRISRCGRWWSSLASVAW
jgi:helix-turn-helix protein